MRTIWEGMSSVHGGAEEWRFQLRSTKQNQESVGRPAWIWRGLIGVWIGGDLISAADDQVNNCSACWNGDVALGAIDSGVFGENAGHDTCYMLHDCTSKLHQRFCDILAHIIPLNAAGYGAERSAVGFCGVSFSFFFCWEIGQKLLLWHQLSRSMNEGIRSDVSPTWQRERRVQLIRSRFNFINVRINSAHGWDTGREAGEEAALVRQRLGSEGEWRETESKEDICPLGCTDMTFVSFIPW